MCLGDEERKAGWRGRGEEADLASYHSAANQ